MYLGYRWIDIELLGKMSHVEPQTSSSIDVSLIDCQFAELD